MLHEEIFIQFSLCIVSSDSILSYIYMSGSVFGILIRLHKAPEYGSNTDPEQDPQHWWRGWGLRLPLTH